MVWEHIVTSLTFSFNILIPQLFGHPVKRPSQFSRCACQEKKSKSEVNSGELREFLDKDVEYSKKKTRY